jgi:hypothetical protein
MTELRESGLSRANRRSGPLDIGICSKENICCSVGISKQRSALLRFLLAENSTSSRSSAPDRRPDSLPLAMCRERVLQR